MQLNRRKKIAVAAVALFAVAGGTGAYAYWTSSGAGDGTAYSNGTVGVEVIQRSTTDGLYPGGPAANLSGVINNGNPGLVKLNGVTATVRSVSPLGAQNTLLNPCGAADFEITGTTGPIDAVPGDTTTWQGLAIRMLETGANQDNCKNVRVELAYTAAPLSPVAP